MAETWDNLYSIGPNAIGQGTYVVKSLMSPNKSRGVVTRLHRQPNLTPAVLSTLEGQSAPVFPGTTIPLSYTYVRQISNEVALIVSNYAMSSGANGFKRVGHRSPNGYRDMLVYPLDDAGYAQNHKNYSGGNPRTGVLLPKIVRVPIVTVRWSSVVYSDSRPADHSSLIGKVNSNSYNIDGYSHPSRSLRFDGSEIIHEKYGGIDRWIRHHAASYDRFGLWENEQVKKDPSDPSGTAYSKESNIEIYEKASFPNMP